jgi:hypothetical protein
MEERAAGPHECPDERLVSRLGLSGAQERVRKISERALKFLAVRADPEMYTTVIRRAAPGILKTLCNAAINVASNADVSLSESEKTVLGRYGQRALELMSDDIPLRAKRRMLLKPAGQSSQIRESANYIPFLAGIVDDHLGMTEDIGLLWRRDIHARWLHQRERRHRLRR